jgi:transposase-like protein
MGSTCRKRTAEFKVESVELLIRSGGSVVEIVRDFGIGDRVLGTEWKRRRNTAASRKNARDQPACMTERTRGRKPSFEYGAEDSEKRRRGSRRRVRIDEISVSLMYEVRNVSRSGFYAWLKRDRPDREKEGAELVGMGRRVRRLTCAGWSDLRLSSPVPSLTRSRTRPTATAW